MNLKELFADIPYRLTGKLPPDGEIAAITSDLREVGAGHLFACTRTPLRDGHYSALAAYEKGCRLFLAERGLPLGDDAAVLVVEDVEALLGELSARFYHYPARNLTVLGITGSLGKSSVALLLWHMLTLSGRKAALLMPTGVLRSDGFTPFGNTVPDALAVGRFLHSCSQEGTELAILELSAYMLEKKAAFSIPFTAVLLTNAVPWLLGRECPKPSAHTQALCSLLAGDAPFKIRPVAGDFVINEGRTLTFGMGGDFSAEKYEPFVGKWGYGTRFTLCSPKGEMRVSLPTPGAFAVENALAAAALGTVVGLDAREIACGIEQGPLWGTLECLSCHLGRSVYRDAAYSPEMLTRALDALRAVTQGRLTVVVGSVGGRAKHRRAPLGGAAEQGADFVYLCADNPNAEDPAAIAADMAVGFTDPSRYAIIPDRREAILRAVTEMRPGDTLLLAGKGREAYQLVAGERQPFSEPDIVREALCQF